MDAKVQSKPMKMRKKIGSTVYLIDVYFKNDDAAETMDEMILRLIKNEAERGKVA